MEYFTLNNGIKMPMAGIGVFMMSPAEAESAVESALKSGVRLIDTANGYMNESGTCRGIKKSGVAREGIFLVTKLWPTVYEKDTAVDETLKGWVPITLTFSSCTSLQLTGVRVIGRSKKPIKKARSRLSVSPTSRMIC